MRVLFLTLYPDSAASPRYRVTQFLPFLRANGVEACVAAPLSTDEWRAFTGTSRRARPFWYHAHETPRRIAQLLSARRHDIVFVQKALMTAYLRGMPTLLRHSARRIIHDIDDAVHLAPPHPLGRPWNLLEDRGQAAALMAMADLVLAGNAWLASETQQHARRVECFPTVVDTDRFTPKEDAPGHFRLGWVGSPSTTPALNLITEVLESPACADLALLGADARVLQARRDAVCPWSFDTEVREIQHFSVGLMPQAKDDWTRGKCALKALLCMACGVPCIATPYGAVLDIIRDGENGLFADSPEAWRAAIERLRDPVFRKRLGEAARLTVEERFSVRAAAPRLLEWLKELA